MNFVAPEHEPITYSLALGDAWYRIRLDDNAEGDVKRFLDVMFDGIPPEAAEQTRAMLVGQFAAQLAAARAKRGLDLYVPAPKPHGEAMPAAAILTAEVVIPAPAIPEVTEIATRIVRSSPGARTGSIAGSTAVRIDHSIDDSNKDLEAADESSAPRRIEYVIAVPDDSRWLSIDLSVRATGAFDVEGTIADFDRAAAELTWPE